MSERKPVKPPRPSLRVRTAARDLHYQLNDETALIVGMNPQQQAEFRAILARHFAEFETAILADMNKRTAARIKTRLEMEKGAPDV